jgi:regulator of sigma E protease
MGTIIGTIIAFIIVFGILVFIHEFGHFFMAKVVGIRVEVFSFGYGKRLFGVKKGHTDYRVSVLPMGGYVRFLGETAYESGAALSAEETREPDHFMAKKRWERFLVILTGPTMNILLAVFLVSIINIAGVSVPEYQDEKPVIGWVEPGSPAEKAGLKIDDEIILIDGQKVPTWADVELAIGTRPERLVMLEISRKGARMSVRLMTEKRTRYDMGYAGVYGKILTQIQVVTPESPAEKGGMKPGDIVEAINGEKVYFYQFIEVIEKNPEKELEFTVLRDGSRVSLLITPQMKDKVGKIGVQPTAKSVIKKYGFFGAIGQSLEENKKLVFLVIDFLKKLVTGRASTRQLGGPLDIANLSYVALRMGFIPLLSWIALISLQLGVLNLFPIPVLDGGQLFVLILEGIRRKDFSAKARQIWMQIGFVIFIALIGFVILNDIIKRLPSGWKSLLPF